MKKALMINIIERIFGVHDSQLKRTDNTYKDKVYILVGFMITIGAVVFYIGVNE